MAPKAVLFDAYGTLFDVHSVALLAEQLFPGQGDALSQAWRDKQIEYTRLLTLAGRYRSFWDLTAASLRYAAQRHGLAAGGLIPPLSARGRQGLRARFKSVTSGPSARKPKRRNRSVQ